MLLGNTKKEIKLQELLDKHIEVENKLFDFFSKKTEMNLEELETILNQMRDLNFKKPKGKLEISLERKYDEKLLEGYNELKKEIRLINSELIEDKIPYISWNNIVKFLNLFEEKIMQQQDFISEIEISNSLDSLATLAILYNSTKLGLCLTNGKKVILTPTKFDFNTFTYNELIEILRVLDVMISDTTYDFLRSEITKQIASISSYSKI